MVSWFWRGRNPIFFFFGLPLLYVCLSFLAVLNVPRSLVPFNVLMDIQVLGAFAVFIPSFLFARSASKVDEDSADAAAQRYAYLIRRLQELRWLQAITMGILVVFAYFTHDGRTLYGLGNPYLTIGVGITVIYLTLLNVVLVPITFFPMNPLLVARVNLMAESGDAGRNPGFFSSAFRSFNRHLKPQTNRRIVPSVMNETLMLSRADRRVLALRLAGLAKVADYGEFLRVLAWSLDKSVDDITEPATLSADIQRLVDRWGPVIRFVYYVMRLVMEIEKYVRIVASYELAGIGHVRRAKPTPL